MPTRIRSAVPEDAPEAVRVVSAVYDEYGFSWDAEEYHADLYDLKSHYLDNGHPFFIAELADGTVAGTAALDIFPTIPGPIGTLSTVNGRLRIAGTDCSMERLYVHPDARRLGLGRALSLELIQAARDHCCWQMEIWSDKRFEMAHALYESLGARIVGDRICHDPDQSPEWGLILAVGKL